MHKTGLILLLSFLGGAGCADTVEVGQTSLGQHTLTVCGGFTSTPGCCATGYHCAESPNVPKMHVDGPGICVDDAGPPLESCGGFAGIPCADGLTCVDDPTDICDLQDGGADCAGICVSP